MRTDSEVFNCTISRTDTFNIDKVFTHTRAKKGGSKEETTTWLAVRPLLPVADQRSDANPD